ncbi:hypothetical protein HDU92_006032 [Lobulomyces angularis]|nr:hypothetical protein HDU92_006032 [Lobulomyces angularis]
MEQDQKKVKRDNVDGIRKNKSGSKNMVAAFYNPYHAKVPKPLYYWDIANDGASKKLVEFLESKKVALWEEQKEKPKGSYGLIVIAHGEATNDNLEGLVNSERVVVDKISNIVDILLPLANDQNIGLYLAVCGGAARQQSNGKGNVVVFSDNFDTTAAGPFIDFLQRELPLN